MENELTINIKKTKLQFFPKNRNLDCHLFENTHDINIDGINLEYVSSFKYLGVEIDRNLTMKSQYEYIFKAVNHKFFLLKLIRRSLTIKAALEVARSMIFSLIDYGNIFLTGCTQEDKSDLQTLQNKILRCSLNINDPMEIHTVEIHTMLDLRLIEQSRSIQLLTLIRKNVLLGKFPLVNHERNTRHNDGLKIKLPIPRNQHVRHSPYYTGCQLWNNLPIEIRESDINVFKKEIKAMVNDNQI